MTPEEALEKIAAGRIGPVTLIVGEERLLAEQVTKAIRERATAGGIPGLNDDTFEAPQAKVDEVLQIARTMPMMATTRFVLARNIETWESGKKSKASKKGSANVGLDAFVDYQERADTTTTLVLVAGKLDKRKRLYTAAKKGGWLVSCESPKRHELPGWILDRARERGHSISRNLATLLADMAGPELSPINDALERVGLYVGEGQPITEEAISECVVRVKTGTVWELVNAVGRRDVGACLQGLDEVYEPKDRGLQLLGVLGWATRQLIKFDEARRGGANPADAAKAAGAPPFKAGELAAQLKGMPPGALSTWVEELARTDLALKGGSRRNPRAVVEQMLLDLCRAQ